MSRCSKQMAHLKNDAPLDIAEILLKAEAQADECWRGLQLRHYPSNIAVRAVLTGGINMVEREQAARGSNTPHFHAMLGNLSRSLPIAVKWAMGHGQPAAELDWRWTGELSAICRSGAVGLSRMAALRLWSLNPSPEYWSAPPTWAKRSTSYSPTTGFPSKVGTSGFSTTRRLRTT